jgi:hypothetical protein
MQNPIIKISSFVAYVGCRGNVFTESMLSKERKDTI